MLTSYLVPLTTLYGLQLQKPCTCMLAAATLSVPYACMCAGAVFSFESVGGAANLVPANASACPKLQYASAVLVIRANNFNESLALDALHKVGRGLHCVGFGTYR